LCCILVAAKSSTLAAALQAAVFVQHYSCCFCNAEAFAAQKLMQCKCRSIASALLQLEDDGYVL
jgi:hypothetical protein